MVCASTWPACCLTSSFTSHAVAGRGAYERGGLFIQVRTGLKLSHRSSELHGYGNVGLFSYLNILGH